MKCRFVDDRTDFFAALAAKLGPEFEFCPLHPGNCADLRESDVVVLGLPAIEDENFQHSLSRLQSIVKHPGAPPVVAFVASADRRVLHVAFAAGAYDCFVETGSMEELRIVLRRTIEFHHISGELRQLRTSLHALTGFSDIVGADPKMHAVLGLASKIAASDATVLLTGESGTGKELLARALHRASTRSQQPFVAVACSALPETLIESELFGHERGAFTGATAARRGRFEAAERGTLFIDEVAELTPALQVKLLRVLQERIFERLGSNQGRQLEARVICATNKNLRQAVQEGAFRLDLYYRLNTVEIELPPLRARRDDILVLAHTFLAAASQRYNRPGARFSVPTMVALNEHSWPGNVRELQNVIERAVLICDGPEIGLEHLPSQFAPWQEEVLGESFEEEVRNFKRRLILRKLLEHQNNKLQAARSLKIARSSLHRLIDELGISPAVLPPNVH